MEGVRTESEMGVGGKFRTFRVSRIIAIISLMPNSPSSIAESAKEEATVRKYPLLL